ncbi:MAG TPA: CHAD domain-containing protein [Rhodanobacteraceae bacterium]|nr:CHAD domain-containing protein [Rhodanobacteraceae bacterium]
MAVPTDIPVPAAESPGGVALPWFDASVLRAYACGELDRALAHLAWRGGRVHEGVHQARKSLRRTRATLALGAAVLGPGAELIDREVRRVNRRLSKMRDAQALVETLDRLIAKGKPPETLPVLRRARRTAAIARVEAARRELASDPGLARKRAMLQTLRAALPALPWDSLTETRVRDALGAGIVEIDVAGARARATGRDEDWHRWRRRVRRLSQQHRATGSLIVDNKAARRRVKTLAELLGEGQDYALLHDHCGKRSIFADPDRQILAALADLGAQRMRARVDEALASTEPAAAGQ